VRFTTYAIGLLWGIVVAVAWPGRCKSEWLTELLRVAFASMVCLEDFGIETCLVSIKFAGGMDAYGLGQPMFR